MKIMAALFLALCLPLVVTSCDKKVDRAGGDPSKPEPSPTSTKKDGGSTYYPSSTYPSTNAASGSAPVTDSTQKIPGNETGDVPGSTGSVGGSSSSTSASGGSSTSSVDTGGTSSSPSGTGGTSPSTGATGGNSPGAVVGGSSPGTTGGIAADDPLAGNASIKVPTGAVESQKAAPCANMLVFNTGGHGAAVRAEPKSSGDGFDSLEEGTTVPAKALVNDAYVQVTVKGKQGYVYINYLTCNAQAAAPGAPGNSANPGVDMKTDGSAHAVVKVPTPDCTK